MTVGELKAKLERALNRLKNYDESDRVRAVTNTYFLKDCSNFLGCYEGYVNLDNVDVEKDDKVDLHDIDLCIALDPADNPDRVMTLLQFNSLCDSYNVQAELEKKQGESGWPTFRLTGAADDVADLLDKLGFDEETIDEMLEGE